MKTVTRLCALTTLSLLYTAAIAQTLPTKSFISVDGHFSVQLPSRPTYSSHPVGSDATAPMNNVFLLEKGDTAYYVSYSDLDPAGIMAVGIDPKGMG